ncbi:protein PIF-like [Mizuhopecten yessoensis]|uniref:Protein PIF n=1 Tax=Mizuhopecten yessoensis TaxID=6573 RepID=A0A210Q9J1_MIZYE|nr:protein PIF-like [Mizuhopecten yessoensis]XP_021363900.1 protein PIF-like [Mizuhopecten yessoensis]OWF45398.1 Protein PIF [Mizuhopecten yessoensis]
MWVLLPLIVLLSIKGSESQQCQCESSEPVCFLKYEKDCKMFIFCVNGISNLRRCAFGTFFDQERDLCTFSAEVACAADPCVKEPSLKSYIDGDGHCKHFWRCVEGKSSPFCCEEGMGYDEGLNACVRSDSCTEKCEVGPSEVSNTDDNKEQQQQQRETTRAIVHAPTTSRPETVAGCRLRMIRHNGRGFYHIDRENEPLMCPEGTKFSESSCGCVDSRYKPTCKLEVLISFGKSDGKIENRATSIFIGHENLDILRGFGLFKGDSQINVPFYTGNDNLSRKFGFQIRLYVLQPKTPDIQTLLSNCNRTDEQMSSLEIKLDPLQRTMRYRARSEDGGWTELVLPYKEKVWTNVLFIFSGTYLQAMLQYVDPVTNDVVEEVQKRPFTNTLKVSPGPLRVGGCSGMAGVKAFVDEIAVSFCKMDFPEKSRP